MKTMKHIVLIGFLACSTTLMATKYQLHQVSSGTVKSISVGEIIESPNDLGGNIRNHTSIKNNLIDARYKNRNATFLIPFQSTSRMTYSGSSLPNAAITGVTTIDNTSIYSGGPRRVSPNNPPSDPFDNPIGDTPWLLIILLVIGYSFWRWKKQQIALLSSKGEKDRVH